MVYKKKNVSLIAYLSKSLASVIKAGKILVESKYSSQSFTKIFFLKEKFLDELLKNFFKNFFCKLQIILQYCISHTMKYEQFHPIELTVTFESHNPMFWPLLLK